MQQKFAEYLYEVLWSRTPLIQYQVFQIRCSQLNSLKSRTGLHMNNSNVYVMKFKYSILQDNSKMITWETCGRSYGIRHIIIKFSENTLCKSLFHIPFLPQKIQLLYVPDVEEETVGEKEHHRTRMANHHYAHLLLMRKMRSYVFVVVKEQDHNEPDPDGSLSHG